ncbi:hypothetical protein KMZ68_13800 [Bradyrhizobium sediminis]|uniref:Uncharacterized protein n=1 Tax=Bradyrhizobium sediminis TaxID=2840469 RepID=A0A975NJ48_9BRAD|nr:hypothetical protein [Bradyrhizobium sediminis]QWG16118.1 hypothetical protein KMZ68_13800 [Bradyrhizobium sediminis]
MASFLDNCDFNATSTGTGDFVVASAITGHQTPASAGAVNAAVYRYFARSADLSQWEVGYDAYTSASVTLGRTNVLFNSAGTGTGSGQTGAGSKVNFSTVPKVAIVPLAEDMIFPPASTTDNAALRADGTGGRTYQNSALIIADTTAALSRSGGGGVPVEGTNTNDDAASGYVGEYIVATLGYASRVTLTNTTGVSLTSISLGTGDWEASGTGYTEVTGSPANNNYNIVSLSTTNNTLDTTEGLYIYMAPMTISATVANGVGPARKSLSGTTTLYLVSQSAFTAGTFKAWGQVRARRPR